MASDEDDNQDAVRDPLEVALTWNQAGKRVALATVIQTWGSAPQPVGSRLAIDEAQNFEGSVSGGCVEAAVIAESEEVIESGRSRVLTYGVSDETAFNAGLACGGTIRIFLERLEGKAKGANAGYYAEMVADRATRRPAVLITKLETGAQRLLHAGDDPAQAGLPGIGLAAIFAEGKSGTIEGPDGEVFLSVQNPVPQLLIIGAVHIAQHLAPLASSAGFAVSVIDPREAFASHERFPGTPIIASWPDEALAEFTLDRRTAMVLLTHDPKIDDEALTLALDSDCFYIGALGSRRTHAKRCERLRNAGVSEQNLERIHAPVGLDIGAAGPIEIAVSIMAELIAVLRKGAGAHDAF